MCELANITLIEGLFLQKHCILGRLLYHVNKHNFSCLCGAVVVCRAQNSVDWGSLLAWLSLCGRDVAVMY